jgi:glyoxylase-like metal-dependent hydrolase (beta-lactamase superfamily II)/8-oxo-dGTP pyrophosphatase MutT (NUDIX family)
MSELVEGAPLAPAPPRPRDSAAVMLLRRTSTGPELLWVLRSRTLRFSAGFWAFPGGSADETDRRAPVEEASGEQAPLRAAAARELFEETGVLVARNADRARPEQLVALRHELLEGRATFAEVLLRLGARLHVDDLTPAGRWITPEFSPIRFDTRFYLREIPAGQVPEIWEGELVGGGWVRPGDALKAWTRGEALLHPPILNAMQTFESCGLDLAAALPRLREPAMVQGHVSERIEFQRGIHVFPLETPTLPPARHTACYIVGNRELLLVDPGSPYRHEQVRLAAFIAHLEREGRKVVGIVATHHHGDHVGGLRVAEHAYRVPVLAHALTASRIGGADELLADRQVLRLEGEPPIELEVLHTPGHTRGHLCLFERESRALLCGDMLSGLSTIVIDPPEGDMAAYLASLRRLAQLEPRVVYPAHGAVMVDGAAQFEEALAHRAWREGLVLESLAQGPREVASVVRHAYQDTPLAMRALAGRSALAGLLKLERDRRVAHQGDLWKLIP